jgi:hypothetical protein
MNQTKQKPAGDSWICFEKDQCHNPDLPKEKQPFLNIALPSPMNYCRSIDPPSYPAVSWEEMRMKICPPFYYSFKWNPYNTIEECVHVLFGVGSNINLLFNMICIERFPKSANHHHGMFLYEILWTYEMIRDGIDSGNIKTIREGEESILHTAKDLKEIKEHILKQNMGDDPGSGTFWIHKYHKQQPFSRTKKLHSLSFLNWAQESGFLIPDELAFYRDDTGELQYRDRNCKLLWVKGEQPQGTNQDMVAPPDDIELIIAPVCPEIKKFYNGLVEELDLVGNYGNIDDPDQENLYKIALDFFNSKQSEYIHLQKNMINDEGIYAQKSRRPRRIIGIILQNYLKKKGITRPYSKLHTLYNDIIQ